MTKFYEHYEIIVDLKTGENVKVTNYFRPEVSPNMSIPKAEDNMDYSRMMDDPETVIEEVDETE